MVHCDSTFDFFHQTIKFSFLILSCFGDSSGKITISVSIMKYTYLIGLEAKLSFCPFKCLPDVSLGIVITMTSLQ